MTEQLTLHSHTEVGSLSLLQGIFLTQELNQGLLHCTWILYQLRSQGSIYIYIYIYTYIIGIGSCNYRVWEVTQSAICNQEIQWYNSVWGQRPEKKSTIGVSPRVQRFKNQSLQCPRAETDRCISSRNKEKKFTLPSPFCSIQVLKELGYAYPHWWKRKWNSLSSVWLSVTIQSMEFSRAEYWSG